MKPRGGKAARTALIGMLGALALTLSFLEGLLPPLPFLPPGAKPGLSNLAVLYAASAFGAGPAFLIVGLKAFFALLTRGIAAGLMSLLGGLLSTAGMVLLLRFRGFGLVGAGVCGGVLHNLGQLLGAMLLTKTAALVFYLPLLIVFGTAFGLLTGLISHTTLPLLQRQMRRAFPPANSDTKEPKP